MKKLEILLGENPDEITIVLPEDYRGKNLFIMYLSKEEADKIKIEDQEYYYGYNRRLRLHFNRRRIN